MNVTVISTYFIVFNSSSKRVTTSEPSVSIILCEKHVYILQSCPSYREVFDGLFYYTLFA